ncbi:MAG TPA: CPBP family intramembrane glutamic endopeptidase [Thermohalobaculum sp.]|nr:CPBP family intramembrane glutamic endopeptidase [Thermohalobaculum sp.]
MSQAAFERYVAPARARPGTVRLLLGLALIIVLWLLWTALVMGAAVGVELYRGRAWAEAVDVLGQRFLSDGPATIALTLATFVGIWPAAWAAVRLLHGRSFGTLLGPERRLRQGELGAGLMLALLLWGAGVAIGTAVAEPPGRSAVAVSTWSLWLAPLAVLVFAQAAGEELLFRGYLLQQLAARWRPALVWGFLPAFLFGLAHLDPTRDTVLNVVYVGTTTMFGLIAAVLVWRTGALSAAMGLHAGNNFGAIGLTGLEGVASGSQLWVYDGAYKNELILVDLVLMTLMLVWLVSPACPRRLRGDARPDGPPEPAE